MKVLVATEKPFAKVAVDGIRKEIEAAGYGLVLLEKYTDKAQLLDAVKDANAIIIRSDIVDAEVLDAAKELKIVVRAGVRKQHRGSVSRNTILQQLPLRQCIGNRFAQCTRRNSTTFHTHPDATSDMLFIQVCESDTLCRA